MKKAYLLLICAIILYGCKDNPIQSTAPETPENKDSVVAQFNRFSEFLRPYKDCPVPDLRMDSIEVYETNPPYYIQYGMLYIYYKNRLIDSISYVSNLHSNGLHHPEVFSGTISDGNYLIKIPYKYEGYYTTFQTVWFIVHNGAMQKMPAVEKKEQSGLCQDSVTYLDVVKKNSEGTMLYFKGIYFEIKERYSTFNLNSQIYKNYCRQRANSTVPWRWEE